MAVEAKVDLSKVHGSGKHGNFKRYYEFNE